MESEYDNLVVNNDSNFASNDTLTLNQKEESLSLDHSINTEPDIDFHHNNNSNNIMHNRNAKQNRKMTKKTKYTNNFLQSLLCKNAALTKCMLSIRSMADSLPTFIGLSIYSYPKYSFAVAILFSCAIDLIFILPCYLISLLITEWGVYTLIVFQMGMIGRFILRLVAFPGSNHRVYGEIESEFANYSVKMLDNACESILDLSHLLISLGNNNLKNNLMNEMTNNELSITSAYSAYESPGLWKRVCVHRDRVLGMYFHVLENILDNCGHDKVKINSKNSPKQPANSCGEKLSLASQQHDSFFTCYGNNCLVGDIGCLSSVTVEAREDGKTFHQLLGQVLRDLEDMYKANFILFDSSMNSKVSNKSLSLQGLIAIRKLLISCRKLKALLPSLQPKSTDSTTDFVEGDAENCNDHDPLITPIFSNNGVHNDSKRFENNNSGSSNIPSVTERNQEDSGSKLQSIKDGISSILPIFDAPAHSSIFGLDVLRGSMLSKYKGARQLWVGRPEEAGGGMIDVIYIPCHTTLEDMKTHGTRKTRAVLYCNPNAGLVEVGTGLSLTGGNVTGDKSVSCWTDFYIDNNYDVYLFNYAGYGRSFGKRKKLDDFKPGLFHILKRMICSSLFDFKPSIESLKSDGLAVASHILKHSRVNQLIVHGESIGGVAAASTAKHLSLKSHIENIPLMKTYPTLLICDRTFCNLEAVAQRLVGTWTGFVIPLLIPFWNTDVAGDFISAKCFKVFAQDAADVIIHDSSSLKAGISISNELKKGVTKRAGKKIDTPHEYVMADWENVSVTQSNFSTKFKIAPVRVPSWPDDKKITTSEAFHFAACVRRIGKVATSLKKKSFEEGSNISCDNEEEGIEIKHIVCEDYDEVGKKKGFYDKEDLYTSNEIELMEVWKCLSCCDGLTGMPLGVAVKEGYDCTVTWLCCTVTFGCQHLIETAENRLKNQINSKDADCELIVQSSDFEFCKDSFLNGLNETLMYPIPMPKVLAKLQQFLLNKEKVKEVELEIQYCVGMFEYVIGRITTEQVISDTRNTFNFSNDLTSPSLGFFLRLGCGHNNQYSDDERLKLKTIMDKACAM